MGTIMMSACDCCGGLIKQGDEYYIVISRIKGRATGQMPSNTYCHKCLKIKITVKEQGEKK